MEEFDSRLDKYLLRSDAESDFRKVIDANEELSAEYKFRKKIIEEFEEAEVLSLRERLDAIHEKIEEPKKASKKKWYILLLLILVSLIIGSILFSKLNSPAPDNSILYATYFKPLVLESNERNSIEEPVVKDFEAAYSAQNYTEAAHVVDELLVDDNQPKWHMFKAACLMQLDQLDSAAAPLKFVVDSGDILYRDQAIWYQALIAIKQNKIEEAREKLLVLSSDPDADFHSEAVQLLKEL